ncbi:kinase binding protein CGI-121-domain-containing protein [Phlebopus sp. FC_14]|nr:kinase binding protein CGI-121-domain-containing protein [Phlebopus sp. FC_14]
MEQYRYPQFRLSVVYAAKFTAVTNASQIRSRIVRAASMVGSEGDAEREAVNFAVVNAKLITSPLHLQTAIYQALMAESQGGLRTKTIHSEIIWALNPTNNISEAIRRYGVSETSTDLIVVHVATSDVSNVEQRISSLVQGTMVPMSTLPQTTDWSSVRKYYKLDTEPAMQGLVGNTVKDRAVLDNVVVSSVAMKSVMA